MAMSEPWTEGRKRGKVEGLLHGFLLGTLVCAVVFVVVEFSVMAPAVREDALATKPDPLEANLCVTQEQRDRMFSEAEWCIDHTMIVLADSRERRMECYELAAKRNCGAAEAGR